MLHRSTTFILACLAANRIRTALVIFVIALIVATLAIAPSVVRAGEAPGGSHSPNSGVVVDGDTSSE